MIGPYAPGPAGEAVGIYQGDALTIHDVSEYAGFDLSFGAGVNSTALAILLIENGWRERIVFADTGTEWPETYCFMRYFEDAYLRPHGFEIATLGAESREKWFKMSLIEHCEAHAVVPFMGARWCTSEYKVSPLERFNGNRCLVGIAYEEAHRQPTRVRPLVDWGIDRDECVRIIQAADLSVPRKSGCWICPAQTRRQWRELWKDHPDLYARAEVLEKATSERRGQACRIEARNELTLAQMRADFESQIEMFDTDDYRAYQPCVCGL